MARVLLIDDDDDVRSTIARMLASAGHHVASFGSGRAALAAAEQQEFDLVLTDVLMPDMDGVEIVRAFNKRTPRPWLMVMTGGSSMLGMDFLSIAPALGADGVIAKPVRAKELIAAVATVLAVANKRKASPVVAAR
jgi:CheY-like chemotaxis protein